MLSGRSQQLRPEAVEITSKLRQQGVRIEVIPTDITDRRDVQRTLAKIDTDMPPLRGVIHTAMVLEDRLLTDLDRATLEKVLWPKVLGGWNLHHETKHLELETFVLFSSLSSVFGHAGQANYSAANALLDSLAYYRRASGLPATVMNWGHLGEVGYLAEREQLGQRLERQGVLSFTVRQATDCLEYALQNRSLQLSVLRMDWSLWRGLGISNRVSKRFAHLLEHSAEVGGDGSDLPSVAQLREAAPAKRQEMVDKLIRHKAGKLLGIPADQIQPDRALLEMGLDSLMAVEMRNWIENHMEIDLPIATLMRSGSLDEVSEAISGIIVEGNPGLDSDTERQQSDSSESEAGTTAAVTEAEAESLLEQLPDMDADEVSQLLERVMREEK